MVILKTTELIAGQAVKPVDTTGAGDALSAAVSQTLSAARLGE